MWSDYSKIICVFCNSFLSGSREHLRWRFVAVQSNKKFCDQNEQKKKKTVKVVETHNADR